VVVGGGPAGLAAAAEAVESGHAVTLLERSDRIGGQMALAGAAPTQAETSRTLVRNYMTALARGKVDIRLGCDGTADLVESLLPDAVVVATGAGPHSPSELDADGDVHLAWDVLAGREPHAGDVLVVDWGGDASGLACTDTLAARGARVTLAIGSVAVGEPLGWFLRDMYLERLYEAGVTMLHHAELVSFGNRCARLRNVFAPAIETDVSCDAVVVALGRVPVVGPAAELERRGLRVASAGDCLAPRTLDRAIYEGVSAARDLLAGAESTPSPIETVA
jgi:NADPH-dependent 2,4-dienoyl-CoA reductase/sulfur reductase-like enzyme